MHARSVTADRARSLANHGGAGCRQTTHQPWPRCRRPRTGRRV